MTLTSAVTRTAPIKGTRVPMKVKEEGPTLAALSRRVGIPIDGPYKPVPYGTATSRERCSLV